MRWDGQATLTHDQSACYPQVVPGSRRDIRALQLADPYPPTFSDHRFGGSSTHLGVGGGNEQC